jgi:hypothetical protein
MPLDDTNWPTADTTEVDPTTALLPPKAASDDATRLLIRARGFLERGWCQGVAARDKAGNDVEPTSPDATFWCAFGALIAAGAPTTIGAFIDHLAIRRLTAAMDGVIFEYFNDRQEAVEQVLPAFDRAIAAGREG